NPRLCTISAALPQQPAPLPRICTISADLLEQRAYESALMHDFGGPAPGTSVQIRAYARRGRSRLSMQCPMRKYSPMSDSTDVDMATVLDLERELQAPRPRADQARLRELLAPDFIEIGASGRRYDRAGTLRSVAQSATQDPEEAGPVTVVGLHGRHL